MSNLTADLAVSKRTKDQAAFGTGTQNGQSFGSIGHPKAGSPSKPNQRSPAVRQKIS
jgi:hypothetical protein